MGGRITLKVRSNDTHGAVTVLESVAASGEGPPLHVHAGEDEVVYTLDGTLRFRLGDELHPAPAGSSVFIPRGLPHTWQNVGDRQARLLAVFTPAAAMLETFFERYAEVVGESDATDVEVFRSLARDAGMDVVGPPLATSHPL